MTSSINLSSIKDNHKHGSVGQFLIDNLKPQADLSIVSIAIPGTPYLFIKRVIPGEGRDKHDQNEDSSYS